MRISTQTQKSLCHLSYDIVHAAVHSEHVVHAPPKRRLGQRRGRRDQRHHTLGGFALQPAAAITDKALELNWPSQGIRLELRPRLDEVFPSRAD